MKTRSCEERERLFASAEFIVMRLAALCMLLVPAGSLVRLPVGAPSSLQQRVAASKLWMSESSQEEPAAAAPDNDNTSEDTVEPASPPSPPLSPMAKLRQQTEQGIVDGGGGSKFNPDNVLPPTGGLLNIAIFLIVSGGIAAALSDAVASRQAGM